MTPFVCPICKRALGKEGGSLRCENRHAFDIARQGYVNFLRRPPDTLYEDRRLFEARREAFAAGVFRPLCDAIGARLPGGAVLDAGCGEGSLLAALPGDRIERGIGIDISREAVRMAAAAYKRASWCVADLCDIPLAENAADCVVNVLTPANYAEFSRVLKRGGLLIKAIPGEDHLREVRALAGIAPSKPSGGEAEDLFSRKFAPLERVRLRYEVPCGEALFDAVFRMTPLTAHAKRPEGTLAPASVTIEATILVGEKRE